MKDSKKPNTKADDESFVIGIISPFIVRNIDFSTLNDKEWLDDMIVDSFIYSRTFSNLIKENHVHVLHLDSCFYQSLLFHGSTASEMMIRGLSNNVLQSDIILSPVCDANHWTLIMIDRSKKMIIELDSKHRASNHILQKYYNFMLTFEKSYNKHFGDVSTWKVYKPKDILMQKNGYDCGVHVCLYADIICSGKGKIPKGNLFYKRKYIESEIHQSFALNLPKIKEKKVRGDSTEILVNNDKIEVLTEFRNVSSQIYLQSIIRKVFKTCDKICLLGPLCLKPKKEKQTMVLCDGCRDWYHKVCVDELENHSVTIFDDNRSFLCKNCK